MTVWSGHHYAKFLLSIIIEQGSWECLLEDGEEILSSFCVLKVILIIIIAFLFMTPSPQSFQVLIPKHFKPPRFLEDLRVFLGDTGNVSLECKVIGIPQPALKWFKDDKELRAGDLHQLTAGAAAGGVGVAGAEGVASSSSSSAATTSDSKTSCVFGVYKCEAENCMGKAVSMATLIGLSEISFLVQYTLL